MTRRLVPTLPRGATLIVFACALNACAGAPKAQSSAEEQVRSETEGEAGVVSRAGEQAGDAARSARDTTRAGLPDAAAAPLEDLNLRRDPIPLPLSEIEYVYTASPTPTCLEIAVEVDELSHVLGKDYDQEADERSLGQKGGEAAGDFVIDTVRGVSTGWIPYRGLVRQATGATRYERRTARAFTAGHARRAYLKGLGAALGCPVPAAPTRLVAPEPEKEDETVERPDIRGRQGNRWGAPVAP